jgi:hypothetical protein
MMVRALTSALLCGVAVVAASACSDPTPPPARVVLESDIGPGMAGDMACMISATNWVEIGSFGNPPTIPVRPVDNNTDNGNGNVSVVCSVKGDDANGYDVSASATLQGAEGGTVSIAGHFATTGDQSNLNVSFQNAMYGAFRQADCTATYTDNKNMGVAPGRVWASLNCPAIVRPDQMRTCAATAQFRFENCDQ